MQEVGDVLYVPEGWYHATLGIGNFILSLSLSYCIYLFVCLGETVGVVWQLYGHQGPALNSFHEGYALEKQGMYPQVLYLSILSLSLP